MVASPNVGCYVFSGYYRIIYGNDFKKVFFFTQKTQFKQHLSTATTPLCFGFFRCRVDDVLQSLFSRGTIDQLCRIHVFT